MVKLLISFPHAMDLYQSGEISHTDVCRYVDYINMADKSGLVYRYPPKFNIPALKEAKQLQQRRWALSLGVS